MGVTKPSQIMDLERCLTLKVLVQFNGAAAANSITIEHVRVV